MEFDWDPEKARKNEKKHGISFEEALLAFYDPHAWIELDSVHSSEEDEREKLIGEAAPGLLLVVFTAREEGKLYRLISARRATRRERRHYEEAKRISF